MRRTELDTTDPDMARQWIADAYTEVAPRLSGDLADFRMRVTSLVTDRFRIDDLVHTMRGETDTAPYQSLVVHRVRSGCSRTAMGSRSTTCRAGDISLMDPCRAGTSAWDPIDLESVALDLRGVQVVGAELSGLPADRVRFGLCEPLDGALRSYWARTVDHVRYHVLVDEQVVASPLVRAEAFRQLATAALAAFPNSALDALHDPLGPPPGNGDPATVRRAIEFMDANAHREIDITQIAAAARIGPRGLQHAFRRHRGQSPLEYLRMVRMDAAHRDLQDADPTRGDTVGAIVAKWGFANPGRFAVDYRRVHGRSPSDTLRR
ncbi:AraC family transcriptional regulator [Actinomycetospora sp. NBRC 106375]|uniref:AraC family transcriptional regulator n=1 Tax=Actinomycetospora sp. NBRC 106375 TaxID=3032207 RepID=UPI0025572462|nr:AraC family transcriptional regulator [Actinomycetospora sp. NBRC 106375]